MSPPEVWGPPTWSFIHLLSIRIKDNLDADIYRSVFKFIQLICKHLPCPSCAQDATSFLSKIKLSDIRSKKKLLNTIFLFHNYVNKKTYKPMFPYNKLNNYYKSDFNVSILNFFKVYNTNGNMSLINESFHRKLIMKDIKKWIKNNIIHYV